MPTTFNVISIGNLTDIDTVEGNNTAENASALVGMTFGGTNNALANDFVELSPVGTPGANYGMNNSPADQFSIDGGATQTFDATSAYNATITYIDGTTATITMVLFQDVSGNTYLAPEFSANADQAALEAAPIRSISLDSLAGNVYTGMTADRQAWADYVTCFTRGTKIKSATGLVAIEDLQLGDLIHTVDNGLQPLRWVGSKSVPARGSLAPIVIEKGALGNCETLVVSPQHRMLVDGWRAELYYGTPEVLVAAKHLVNDSSIRVHRGGMVDYFHIMFDHHELVHAAGIISESFNPEELAMGSLAQEARDEIYALFPSLRDGSMTDFGSCARPVIKAHEARFATG